MQLFNWNKPYFSTIDHGLRDWIVLFNIITVNMLAIISAIATIVANTNIQGSLVINDTQTVWIGLIYLILIGATVPFAVFAAERFGYKCTLFTGVAVFMIGSILGGMSDEYYPFLLFRAISGIGAGVIFPLSLTIITKTFQKSRVTLALSLYIALAFGMGISMGFFIGGYFAEYLSWRMIYFADLFSGPFNLLLTWLMQSETEKNEKLKFDISGYCFFLLFLASALVMINNAKAPWNTEGWSSPFILTCIATGIVSFILFIYFERRTENPVFALHLFKIRSYALGCLAIFLVGALLFGTATSFTPLLERSFLYSKSKIGLILMPLGLSFGLTGSLSSYLSKVINIRVLALTGMVIVAITCFLNHYITIQSDHFDIIGLIVLRGIGLGLSLGPLTSLALSEISAQDAGQGAIAVTIFRQIGGAFGGSVILLIQTMRSVYHSQRFAEQIDIYSARYQEMVKATTEHIVRTTGASLMDAKAKAVQLLIANVDAQSSIVSLNDGYFIFGHLILLSALFISFTMVREWKRRSNP